MVPDDYAESLDKDLQPCYLVKYLCEEIFFKAEVKPEVELNFNEEA